MERPAGILLVIDRDGLQYHLDGVSDERGIWSVTERVTAEDGSVLLKRDVRLVGASTYRALEILDALGGGR